MFLLVMLVRLSYYYVIFLHFDRSEERRDRAKISLVSQHDFQQFQVFFEHCLRILKIRQEVGCERFFEFSD